jgi:ABC-type uncharacterized transport system substrate-binding protein
VTIERFTLARVVAAARTFGFEVDTLDIRRAEDIALAFEALKGRATRFISVSTHS